MNPHLDRVEMPLFFNGIFDIPRSPKDFEIIPISQKRAAKLNKLWHSSMPQFTNPNVCKPSFAAVYQGVYFAVAMWSYPIAANRLKGGEKCLELRRFAISSDSPRNTATYMLSKMTKFIYDNYLHIERLISYQDTQKHYGTIYKAANWKPMKKSKYISWGNHSRRPGKIEQSKAPKIRWEYKIR